MKKIYTNLVLILAFIAIGFTGNAQDLVINQGGSVTVENNTILHCDSKIIINTPGNSGTTGSLMIKSDAETNPVTADGGVEYKRFLSLAEWHMITSPVVGKAVTSAMSGNSDNIYLYDTPNGAWARTTETMVEDKGYLVMSNYYTINYASILFPSTNVSITGEYNIDDNMGDDPDNYKDWNFTGNKNTCAIDLAVVLAESNDINITIHTVHDGAYGTYTIADGGMNGGSQYVLPTQGFMFVAEDAVNSLVISHNAKVHKTDASEVFSKKNSKTTPNQLKLSVSGNDKTNEMKLKFSDLDGVTENYDKTHDVLKSFALDNKVPECYLVTPNNENITLDYLPESKMDNYYSAMGFRVMTAGTYTIDITEYSFDPTFPVILEDTHTAKRVDLSLGANYTFTSEAGEFSGRFNLYFNPSAVPTDVEDFADGSSIKVYTNKNNLYINLNTSDLNNARVEIYNLLGSKVIDKELHANQTILDLDLTSGDYIVKVISGVDTKVSKVFVN